MKKLISMLLCLVFVTLTLVGCGKDRIGEDLDDSMKGYEKESLSLNFYIVGDTTNDNATVNARINNYTTKKFNTTLNIVYCNENDYEAIVTQKLDAAKAAIDAAAVEGTVLDDDALNAIKNKPDIILINSPEMMLSLYEKGHLADLTEFFYPDIYEEKVEVYPELKNKFHAELIKNTEGLHNQIAETLMDASLITEETTDPLTNRIVVDDRNYCVPNNRVVGSYTYLLIHRDTAEEVYMGSASQLASFNLNNMNTIVSAIEAKKGTEDGFNIENYVKVVEGKYEDKVAYENAGYACNIVEYPQVAGLEAAYPDSNVPANVDNVYNSAFVVNKNSDVDRAMEIIYAINTDDILHNYLQYGVQDTNYTINQTTGLIDHSQINPDNKYYMNSIYTGDIFRIHANETWNDVDKVNGKIQNDQSRVYKSSDN